MSRHLVVDNGRPRTRGECIDGPRPCPWVSCRYHLEHPAESCALDVADRGPSTVRRIGKLLGMPQTTVSWVIGQAVAKLRTQLASLHDELGMPGHVRTIEERVLGALESGPVSLDELSDRIDAARGSLHNTMDKLRRNGRVMRSGAGHDATWSLVDDDDAKEAA